MKRTGLPYDMDDMDEIKNNGAIVDMSNIDFPGIPEDKTQRTAFIFFRNTGFNVQLDFSNCSFEDKEKFLMAYLTENIDVNNVEFALSYIKIMNVMLNKNIDIYCILTDDEIHQFIDNHTEFLKKMIQLIMSIPVFAMFYFKLDKEAYDTAEFEKCDDELISENMYHIIATPELLTIFDSVNQIKPLFYTNIFTYENHTLLESIQHLPFFSVLHGLCTEDSTVWKDMSEKMENFNMK